MAFWRSKTRTPPELVKALRDNIGKLDAGYAGSESRRKAAEEISKTLTQIKAVLYGDGGMSTLSRADCGVCPDCALGY
jgi:calcium binding protein 39